MAPTVKKLRGLRIARFKRNSGTGPMVPLTVAGGGAASGNTGPGQGEAPSAILKVHIISCDNLLAKDRNGKSDPFVVAAFVRQRFQTPVVKATLNPQFPLKGSVFEFPLHLSSVAQLGILEFVVWDKDMFTKDYLGEIAIPLDQWFPGDKVVAFDDPQNEPLALNLISSRSNTPSQGVIHVKLGLVKAGEATGDLGALYADFKKRSKDADPTLISAPPTEGIGTVRFSVDDLPGENAPFDDGLSSDSEGEDDDYFDNPPASPLPLQQEGQSYLDVFPKPPVTQVEVKSPPPSELKPPAAPEVKAVETKSPRPGFLPRMFSTSRKNTISPSPSTDVPLSGSPEASTLGTYSPGPTKASPPGTPGGRPEPKRKGSKFRRQKTGKAYNLSGGDDILGIVLLEVVRASDLPKLKNMTRTGWDMDPFTVISFGKKVFRTRVIRHSLNPQWDEKLLFHVRRYETSFRIQFNILDWDKFSGNDSVGEVSLDVNALMESAPKPDPVTGLYPDSGPTTTAMKEFKLPLKTAKDSMWEKHNPEFTFRAQYQPYDALRQQFWRQYLKQYDTDDTNAFSHIELTSMLDSLGSTLSRETIDSFFTRHGKTPSTDELTLEEAVMCLEKEVSRPMDEKKRLPKGDEEPSVTDTSNSQTQTPGPTTLVSTPLPLDQMDFSGPTSRVPGPDEQVDLMGAAGRTDPNAPSGSQQPMKPPRALGLTTSVPVLGINLGADDPMTAKPGDHQLQSLARNAPVIPPVPKASISSSDGEEGSSGSSSASSVSPFERVINIKNCPLCHRPRLNSKGELDIVTHLAVCASQDWAKVDRIVVGNFVTSSQAQRKWYTKVLSKVSSGAYQLGANSANIIVQNRMTGQLEEEKMQVYVRLGIRLLYKGAKSRMEGARARRLLKSLSIKQGIKYDAPESAREIPAFIEFHNLDVNEIRDPLDSFKTFNEFFYRKLKENARPVAEPDNPGTVVSGADCRMMAFETVSEATRLWIKGREFTVARLLGEQYKDQAAAYTGGALCIFRLAPQDYHRYHSPVDGKVGPMTYIAGEYYTVNPQAIRTGLDVYGENARKIVPIDSPNFGRVMCVCIGAMMVGSIVSTVNEGDSIARGQEFGYFAFGGSTIVVLFEKDAVQWDEDLLINGRASLETLVRVGMRLGKSTRPSPKA